MFDAKQASRYKEIILTVFFAGFGILLSKNVATAFDIKYSYTPVVSLDGTTNYLYSYTLVLTNGETFTPGKVLELTGLVGVTSANVGVSLDSTAGGSEEFFKTDVVSTNKVVWTSTKSNSTYSKYDNFTIFSPFPPGSVNWSFNGSGSPTSGTIKGPVPEPITTVLGSSLALGFGGLLKREYSRKQKKLKDKAII